MNEPLPEEIEVVELADGVRYRLPLRPLGRYRWSGIFIILLGLPFAGGAVFFVLHTAHGVVDTIIIGVFAAPFLLAGLALAGLGLLVIGGNSEVELSGGRLRAIERLGPLRWSRHRPMHRVRKLVVSTGETAGRAPPPNAMLAELAAIKAECTEGRPLLVAPGYPRKWLLAPGRRPGSPRKNSGRGGARVILPQAPHDACVPGPVDGGAIHRLPAAG